MRKYSYLVLAALLFIPAPLRAADAANAPATRIGVVDMQTIAMDCDAAKEFKEKMESKYGKERSNLEKQGQALKKQAETIKSPKVSDDKKVSFIKARQKLEQNTQSFVRKIEQEEVKFRQDMVSLVFSATYEVAKAKGYNFVVDITGGGVLYADPSMDLTKDVLAEVNKIYKNNQSKAASSQENKDTKK